MQGSINFDGSLVGNITGGGGGGDSVIITPVVTSGTKIADISVNGVDADLYAPNPTQVTVDQVQQSGTKIATIGVNGVNTDIYTPEGGGLDVEITPVVTSGTKIADVSVGGVEKDLYTPDYGADIAALDGRLDIAEDNITSLTGRVGTAEGNITNLAGHMTEAETDITEIKQSLSDLTPLEKTASGAIATFDDGSDLPMPSLKVAIEPQQDLHGYDSPWVGGAGKNKLNAVDGEKTSLGISFVSENGIITANGTSTGNAYISICGEDGIDLKANTSYILSGCPTGGSSTTYQIDLRLSSTFGPTYKAVIDRGSGFTFTTDEAVKVYPTAIVRNGYVASNFVFKPMIRLASETDATFEPYSNICPIIGWSEANVTVADDVETPTVSNVYTIDLDGTRYGGTLDVISGVLTITDGYIASYNSEALPSTWISDRDVYAEGTTPTVGAEVVYKLATPQSAQLTPTQIISLLGVNNIYADTGDLELTYFVNNSLVQAIYDMLNILK